MLTKNQVSEIREHLDKAQNPVFFFDNDPDGLCSFLLLRRYLGRGRGVPIKSFPSMIEGYLKKVREFEADYIFILDKPVISEEFFRETEKINIPVVWIDHHLIDSKNLPSFVNYYNPLFNEIKTEEPVTALCFQISNRKEDLWIACVGCLSDNFLLESYSTFEKEYPELTISFKNILDILYKSPLGKIARIFSYGLKDRTTNVNNMIKFLINAKSPIDILNECKENHSLHKRFKEISSKYEKLMSKAVLFGKKSDKIIFFKYGGSLSISGDLANELKYIYPNKIIVVVYVKGMKVNISMRGKKVINIFLKAIEGIDGATGGGHEDAVGGQMSASELDKFRQNLESIIR